MGTHKVPSELDEDVGVCEDREETVMHRGVCNGLRLEAAVFVLVTLSPDGRVSNGYGCACAAGQYGARHVGYQMYPLLMSSQHL